MAHLRRLALGARDIAVDLLARDAERARDLCLRDVQADGGLDLDAEDVAQLVGVTLGRAVGVPGGLDVVNGGHTRSQTSISVPATISPPTPYPPLAQVATCSPSRTASASSVARKRPMGRTHSVLSSGSHLFTGTSDALRLRAGRGVSYGRFLALVGSVVSEF